MLAIVRTTADSEVLPGMKYELPTFAGGEPGGAVIRCFISLPLKSGNGQDLTLLGVCEISVPIRQYISPTSKRGFSR